MKCPHCGSTKGWRVWVWDWDWETWDELKDQFYEPLCTAPFLGKIRRNMHAIDTCLACGEAVS